MSRRPVVAHRFYTTHQVAKMLGVTAATVVNWVRAGHLSAHRTPGGHRRIRETELVAFAATRGVPLDLEDAPAEETSPARVLLVDDDADFAELVANYLEEKHGWSVHVVTSGFAAGLAVARVCPQAVLLDLLLPGFDGFSVASELGAHADLRPVPIVAMSGHTHLLAEARRRCAFVATLRKPVDLHELSSVLERVVKAPAHERRATALA